MSSKRIAIFCLLTILLSSFACSRTSKRSGLFPIAQKGKMGYIDKKGQVVIAPQFDTAWAFCHGKAQVEQAGETFYIDTTGARTAPPADAAP